MSKELTRIHQQSFADASAATRSAYPPERRLSGEQLARFLDAHRYGVAATTRRDGRPHATPTLYVRTGAVFWMPTMTGTVRARNIERQPWLSLVISEGEDEAHVAVLLEGPADIVPVGDAPGEVWDTADDLSWVSCWLTLKPDRSLSYAARDANP